jgi:hypothetical protein
MGKRELLLIVAFVILGGIVYQFTAPPAAPGEQGFSLSKMIDGLRREVRGNRASAQHTITGVQAIDNDVTEMRVTLGSGPLTIVGEERADVSAELDATSNGYDQAEADRLVREVKLKFDRAASILFLRLEFPEGGVQRVRGLTLKVPARLVVRTVETHTGQVEISKVAGVELGMARGDTNVREIKGNVTVSHRGGDLVISDAGSVKLTTRGSDVTLERIRGQVTINSQAGELKTSAIAGPIELESNGTDVRLEGLESTNTMVRVNATGGALEIRGLRSESRIDLRNTELELVLDQPAIVAVYSEGDEPMQVTLPAGGFRLDALAREGGIRTTPDDLAMRLGLQVTRAEPDGEEKVLGSVKGGGPLLTLRSRGAITLAASGEKTKP